VNFSSPGVWAPVKSNDPYVVNALNHFGTDAATLAAQFASLTSAPALAWNSNLNVSATNYSDLMVSLDQQAHTLDGLSIPQRIVAGCYGSNRLKAGENLFAADAFYTLGEGLAGVAVNVYDDLTNTLLVSGFTNSAGGYNLSLQGLTSGITYRVEAVSTGLAAQTFTLNSTIANFGAPVVMFDNVHASFQTVPEPGSGLLCLVAGLLACSARRRPVGSQICRRGAEGQRTQRFVSSKNSATSAPLPLCGEALPE